MNRRMDTRFIWGGLLVLGGIAFLLQNLGMFRIDNLGWGLLMGLGGLLFLKVVVTNRANWWALIPGMTLLYLSALIILTPFLPAAAAPFGGALFLAVIGLAFFGVYLLQPANWWAIIPAGTMITLGIVAASSQIVTGVETGAIFFLGLGATFLVLSLVKTGPERMRWPLIPGGILVIMGGLIGIASASLIGYIWPAFLILAGVYLFFMRVPQKS